MVKLNLDLKNISIILILILMGLYLMNLVSAETFIPNDEKCFAVYQFIIEHYNPIEKELDFTDDDFDLFQMQTTINPTSLKNYIIYYEDLCDYELPFIDYNGEWPREEVETEKESQSIKEGLNQFLEQFKKDFKKIGIVLIIIILLVVIIDKYG